MTIPTESYKIVHERYSKAIAWMTEIGVNIGSGRLAHYDKVIGFWKDKYKTATKEEAKNIFQEFVNSMLEVHDFIDIYAAFHETPKGELTSIIEKLRKGVNGPINPVKETSRSTAARNFLFEAVVAARSHRPSASVEAILDAESDSGIRISNNRIWIECKRVTTPTKLYDNVRKASRQLESLLKRKLGSRHRGMVALDVSKILTEGDEILVRGTELELLESVDNFMDTFIRQYSIEWEKVYARRHRKIIGTIIRFAFMSSVEDKNIIVHTSQWAVNPRAHISSSDDRLQRVLAGSLKKAG